MGLECDKWVNRKVVAENNILGIDNILELDRSKHLPRGSLAQINGEIRA